MDQKHARPGSPLQDIKSMSIKPSLSIRDKTFQHVISIIDDETSSTYTILTSNKE